jgi:murein tripeptide amidase MpaA
MKLAVPAVAALLVFAVPGLGRSQGPSWPPESLLPPAPVWSGASERLIAPAEHPWITPGERTGLTATPSYDQTISWLTRLDAASPLIRMERFGRTAQGRDLWVVIASKGRRFDPDKPTLLAQAGIHSGEIDGKDAGLMLLRDIAFRGKSGLLDDANLLFVPVFNADGHERTSPYNRPNQRGPVSQGWRTTAQNLNLNRDYLKADSPEMRAMIGLIWRWEPDLYLDLHVTDGLDYQQDITFDFNGYGGRGARSVAIGRWLDEVYRPAIEAGLRRGGHVPGPYINTVDARDPAKGIVIAPSGGRFSTGYGDLRRLPTVLLETHSLKPYRRRVLGTYVVMEESLRLLGGSGRALPGRRDGRCSPSARLDPRRHQARRDPQRDLQFLPVQQTRYLSPARPRGGPLHRPARAPISVPVFGEQDRRVRDPPARLLGAGLEAGGDRAPAAARRRLRLWTDRGASSWRRALLRREPGAGRE